MANTERARKLLVRSMIATSATVTTLFGAQNLAAFDLASVNASFVDESDVVLVPEIQATQVFIPQATAIPATLETTIVHSAPSITILREAGQVNNSGNNSNSGQLLIQPPNPVAVAQPDPVIIQAPQQQVPQQQVQQQAPQQQQQVVIVRSNNSKPAKSKSSR